MGHIISRLQDQLSLERRLVLALALLTTASSLALYALPGVHRGGLAPLVAVAAWIAVVSSIAHYALFKPYRQLVLMARDRLEAAQRAGEGHLAAVEQLQHSDRLATLGLLASSMAHELGNPLNVIELRAQLVSSGDVSSLHQAQQNAVVIVEQTRRMTRIISEMLSFARPQPAMVGPINLANVVRKAMALSYPIAKQYQATIELALHSGAIDIKGDADKLLQMIVNLVVNGVQAMPAGGKLTVRTGEAKPYVYIAVVDEGAGIPAELVSKVFEPFFSTKSAVGGTGLGLSVAQGIAREHAGWIAVTSELDHGSTFQVYLPRGRHDQHSEDGRTSQATLHR